jgi:subtilisin family serine protease
MVGWMEAGKDFSGDYAVTIEEQLEAMGHARVIVVLKPAEKKRAGTHMTVALSETISLQQEAARKLEKFFKPFANSRTSILVREAAAAATGIADTGKALVGAATNIIGSDHDSWYTNDPNASAVQQNEGLRYFPNLGILFGTADEDGVNGLRSHTAEVSAVLSPPEMSLIHPVEDAALAGPNAGNSWALDRLRVPFLWDKGLTGEGILIGHLDTGVDTAHPAISGSVDAFAEFDAVGRSVANPQKTDSGFHGTHTAGILVGKPYEGATFGVAPGAKLVAATVIEHGDTAARVIAGLEWCIGQGIKVVNLSLGVRQYEPLFSRIFQILRERQILPVAAIGNEGAQTSRTPGNLREVLSVGAMDAADQIWLNSSSQELSEEQKRIVPTVIAPGAAIWSCVPNGGLRGYSGTSMAAPHIAGFAVLLMQHRPEATIDQIEETILASCNRPDTISTLRGNKGVPDGSKAWEALQRNTNG